MWHSIFDLFFYGTCILSTDLLPELSAIVVLLVVVCGCLFVFCDYHLGKKAMLGYMSHRATHGRDSVDLMSSGEPMHRLAGSCSPSTGHCCHLVDLQIFP